VFSSSQSVSINLFRDILHGQSERQILNDIGDIYLFLDLGKVISRRAFIEETNINRTNRGS
jgi:hypothetical protein